MPSRVFAAILASDAGARYRRRALPAVAGSPAAISGRVRYLIQVGLIVRERDPGSRRDVYAVGDDAWYEAIVAAAAYSSCGRGRDREGVDASARTRRRPPASPRRSLLRVLQARCRPCSKRCARGAARPSRRTRGRSSGRPARRTRPFQPVLVVLGVVARLVADPPRGVVERPPAPGVVRRAVHDRQPTSARSARRPRAHRVRCESQCAARARWGGRLVERAIRSADELQPESRRRTCAPSASPKTSTRHRGRRGASG
jgi:hypothetical protein